MTDSSWGLQAPERALLGHRRGATFAVGRRSHRGKRRSATRCFGNGSGAWRPRLPSSIAPRWKRLSLLNCTVAAW